MSLKEVFEEYSDRDWVFIEPGGNQGDELIYLGAYKLADEVGLNYQKFTYGRNALVDAFDSGVVIYLQGGGGFTPIWNWTPWLLRNLRRANPRNLLIIGPTTTVGYKEYLDRVLKMDGRMIFFAREETTYREMQDYCNDVRLEHDTALYLRPEDLPGEIREDHSLLVLREDKEAGEIPELIDIEGFDMVLDPCRKFKDLDGWVKLHMHANRIVSNRSHSAILGAILGKDTSLFAGSYHKNRSIWEYSLRDMGVNWIG